VENAHSVPRYNAASFETLAVAARHRGDARSFYHANVRTPRWLRFFIQTPELHSIHHQYDVHRYNFSDIPLWDRLFGTYKDTTDFSSRCGFPKGAEEKLVAMLAFKDVYHEEPAHDDSLVAPLVDEI
jgi:sterol desaturase/sphingolipid hydroxylase (fatty acid hydroxylase superfamily)